MSYKQFKRIIALLLSITLLGQMIPVEATAASTAEDQNATLPGEASTVVLGEVSQSREESVKHFRMGDGSYIAVDYGMPVHYADDGIWVDIDNTLILEEEHGTQTARAASGNNVSVWGTVEKMP